MISPRELLKHLEKRPRKRLGQHFLIHEHSVKKIVEFAQLQAHDVVLEIGAGLGALTIPVARKVAKIHAVEIDPDLLRLLREKIIPRKLEPRITLIDEDILKMDLRDLADSPGKRLIVLGNLPYNISSPVLFRILEHSDIIEKAVVMLQTEVAERLLAEPGTKDYGILTVLFAYKATIKKGFNLKPEEFYPAPKVGSTVVGIYFDRNGDSEKLDFEQEKFFVKIVKTTFGQRRKMLRKSLLGLGQEIKEYLPDVFERSGISPDARPETLSVNDFCRLTKEIYKIVR